MTTSGVGVAEGDDEGDGLADPRAANGWAGVSAWTAPQEAKANARTGAIIQTPGTRIIARGFYDSGDCESIRTVLTLFDP